MHEYETATVYVSPLKRRLRLFWRVLGTTFDVGLMVVGSALVAVAAVVLLDGFGVVELGLTTSTGAMLGSSLVIAVFGAFAIGVAVEGPVRQLREHSTHEIELAVARGVALLVTGIVLLAIGRIGLGYIGDLPRVFDQSLEVVVATGIAGFTWTIVVGLVALWSVRRVFADRPWLDQIELPLLYIVWAIGVAVVYGVLI
ncbi:hypothetical protein BMS3Abin02_01431 [bacterium BMS3Abin02]|nr:hypothetical protein BMS3Abin02_01431 [bacterium BMS3Abin02]GBE22221.1 hypothetical protein BMS3Bbin01_01590 [bacterium BMS3Bbin01]HDH26196.1 hypothetical protein [Actinomycetota bacterium]HDK46277.1 hypothetical protein [Actinomycetota bacterium]HDL49484.1 hypothetical protein [Actinomycetota bacterium]